MADYISKNQGGPDRMGGEIEKMMAMAINHRKSFERKWYDNNFFDDGYHFRYISRSTGKIIDLNDAGSVNMPQRAIPKASRQIRGIANLLMAPKYVPVIYPERIVKSQYPDPNIYQQAWDMAKKIASKQGAWLEEEWKDQMMKAKLTLMLILAAKHSISYIKVWPDADEEKIVTSVRDAFDIYLIGTLNDLESSPFVIEAVPTLISDIKANKAFDKDQLEKISPDNKYASSEIKQVYMQSRFGSGMTQDDAATLILKEAFIKRKLTEDNIEDVMQKTKDPDILAGKRMGSIVMHHVFVAGGITLKEEYLDLQEYPFVDYRYEPGALYQKPPMDNYTAANKSLDVIISRLEKWANSMVTGVYQKRKGENYEISNFPGGQVIEYQSTPLTQMNMANVPPAVFELIGFFNQVIEEQGASTSSLGTLPQGVKSGVAIESVKATEYANLEISAEQLKNTIERISKKMLRIADDYFMKPQTVSTMSSGNADYMDVMGMRGINARKEVGMEVPEEVVPISKESKVRIEIESGLGFTMEGKKQTMQQIINFIMALVGQGMVSADAVKVLVQKFLEVYQFGSTAEFMEAMDSGTQAAPLNEDQIQQMKVAFVESMKDTGMVGPEADQKLVDSTKLGTVEALKDTGVLDSMNKQAQPAAKGPSESISFKDLPPEGKVQMAAQAGIQVSPESIKQQDLQAQKAATSNFNKGGANATQVRK